MNKSKALRIGGFTLAVGLTASLVGFAAHGTGAYFTDTQNGEIDAGTGTIHLTINSPQQGKLVFANLLPGDYSPEALTYQASTTSTQGEDVWLVFPTTGGANGTNPSEAFTGNPKDGAGGGLGAYGHFAVSAPAGSFTSYNLNNDPPANLGDQGPVCSVDGNGHGGSNAQQATRDSAKVPYCGVPQYILLSSGLKNGQQATANITFGFTPLLTGPQGQQPQKLVSYQLVATQHGVLPNDPNN